MKLSIPERMYYLSGMERLNPSSAANQLELISRYQTRMGQRLHSSPIAYACLGLLWAAPIAAMAAGLHWSAYTGLIVVVITALWATTLTRKRGVTMPPTYPSSRATIYAVWLFIIGTMCALVALWAHTSDIPFAIFTAALISAATTAFAGSRIDHEIVQAGRKRSISK